MFTFGIFTTHFPYVVFIVFYAWFLIFGVDQANDGKIRITENSVQIEYHVNHAHSLAEKLPAFYYQAEFDYNCFNNSDSRTGKQKWKIHQKFRLNTQDIPHDSLFCRPPPTLA